jgi:hypothetical protein
MKGFGESYCYMVSVYGCDYYIPKNKIERFNFLNDKIARVSVNKDYSELAIGLGIQFRNEFKAYLIPFKRGQVWVKDTESWMGNDAKGTKVKIVRIDGQYIFYRKYIEVIGFNIGIGYRYCLNKFSFIRIFER